MDAYITRIENSCNWMALDFCITENWSCFSCEQCDNFTINAEDGFEWRTITRRNNFYNYQSRNGGYSTCMRDDKKVVSIKIDTVGNTSTERTIMRKKIDKIFGSYDCCDDCCPITVYFTDGDGEEYMFTAQAWSSTTTDNYKNTCIMTRYETTLEVCDNTFYNVNTIECCGSLGNICGFDFPYTGCTEFEGSKFLNYEGNGCWDYTITITANKLVNPKFFNITKNAFYGINGQYTWEIIIDSNSWVTYNWNRVSPLSRIKWSDAIWIGFGSGANEMLLLAESWEATWCIEYWNNLI